MMPRPQSAKRAQKVLPGLVAAAPRPSKTPGYRRGDAEAREQAALILWRNAHRRRYPELAWLHAVPNGYRLSPAQAGKAKAQGLTAGVWDLFLPVTAYPFGGLYLEMKAGRNALTEEQKAFRAALESDYEFALCRSWVEAARAICDYLGFGTDHPARRGLESGQ